MAKSNSLKKKKNNKKMQSFLAAFMFFFMIFSHILKVWNLYHTHLVF